MKLIISIRKESAETFRTSHPIYKDDLAIDAERESGQMFFRYKLNGKLQFVRDDYAYIMAASFDEKIFVKISNEGGEFWNGYFMRTDCSINFADNVISVQPEPLDEYTEIMKILDNEVNLPSLPLPNYKIIYQKRPLIQVLMQGMDTLSNFIGGISFEQTTNITPDASQLTNTYYFAPNAIISKVNVSGGLHGVNGVYYGSYSNMGDSYTATFYREDDRSYFLIYSASNVGRYLGLYHNQELLYDETQQYQNPVPLVEITMSSKTESSAATATATNYPFYARYLLDVATLGSKTTYTIPESDVVDNNRNYHRCIGYGIKVVYYSRNFSANPTPYGQAPDGRYYLPPSYISGQKYYPICQSAWTDDISFWFAFHDFDAGLEVQGRASLTLRNSWRFSDVIKELIKGIGLSHSNSAIYSTILYGAPPSRLKTKELYFTPKSNIIVGDYNNPATIAKTTLREILDFFKNAFNIYWHVEYERLRLEHISYYNNGESYTAAQGVAADLTQMIRARSGKAWSFAQKDVTFDKESMPERYQYAWMDATTAEFGGGAIVIKSNYVQPGKVEDVQIANFTSDIDYILLNPSAISMDGFIPFSVQNANLMHENNIVRYDDTPIPLRYFAYDLPRQVVAVFFKSTLPTRLRFVFYDAMGNAVGATPQTMGSETEKETSLILPRGAASVRLDLFDNNNQVTIRTIEASALKEIAYYNDVIDGVTYSLQNGDLAMINLQPKYLIYNLPTANIEVNGYSERAKSVKKNMLSSVVFPSETLPDPKKLIKTDLGVAEIEKFSLNLQSNSIKANVRYDNTAS